MIQSDDTQGLVTRGDLQQLREQLIEDLQGGRILVPNVNAPTVIRAGGVNHCPNSDLSYSKNAATVPGTLPATAGDGNQEAFRFFRQVVGANIVTSSAFALKAKDHSLFPADESINTGKPRWDRVNGWAEIGSVGTQYDLAVQLPAKIVGPGQLWYVRFRCVAIDGAILPADLQFFAGVWSQTGAGEGYATGDPFQLGYEIHGTVGATPTEYRVLAATDSGVQILSDVLTIANAPTVLSTDDYPKIFYNAGAGFIYFEIYRKRNGVFRHLFTVRNSIDLQFNDTELEAGEVVQGWPVITGNAPLAYAETRNVVIPPVGSTWAAFDLTLSISPSYNFSLVNSNGQFLRIGVTGPTGVDRHLAIDRIWFSTTYNEWAPDILLPFPDGTFPIPTISPTEGNQGPGSGVEDPPDPGTGGGPCITTTLPVLVYRGGRYAFREYQKTLTTDGVKGRGRAPQTVLSKFGGTCSEYYVIETKNGIHYECNAMHQLFLDVERDESIAAQSVIAGETKLDSWVRGRWVKTLVTKKELIPVAVEVGSYTLRDPEGRFKDGKGVYIAGRSRKMDRGLPSRNVKPFGGLL